MPTDQEINISQTFVLGDSLTERGTAAKRKILGFIPMFWVSGLSSKSPNNRFTNGLNWLDAFITSIVNMMYIRGIEDQANLKIGKLGLPQHAKIPHKKGLLTGAKDGALKVRFTPEYARIANQSADISDYIIDKLDKPDIELRSINIGSIFFKEQLVL